MRFHRSVTSTSISIVCSLLLPSQLCSQICCQHGFGKFAIWGEKCPPEISSKWKEIKAKGALNKLVVLPEQTWFYISSCSCCTVSLWFCFHVLTMRWQSEPPRTMAAVWRILSMQWKLECQHTAGQSSCGERSWTQRWVCTDVSWRSLIALQKLIIQVTSWSQCCGACVVFYLCCLFECWLLSVWGITIYIYIYMYCLLTYSRHELDNIEERNCVLRTFWRSTIRIWPWSMESLAPRTKGNHDRPQGWVQSMLFNIYRYITLASSTTYISYISFICIYIYYIYRYRKKIYIYIYIYIDLLHHLICCRKRMDNGRWNPDAPVPISAVLQWNHGQNTC